MRTCPLVAMMAHVTVIAFQGDGNASVSGTAASLEQVTALVASADRAATVADDSREVRDRTLSTAAQAIGAAVLAHPALDHGGRRAIGGRSRARICR